MQMQRSLITKERILLGSKICPICKRKNIGFSINSLELNFTPACTHCSCTFFIENNMIMVKDHDGILGKYAPLPPTMKYLLKTDKEADICTVIQTLKSKGVNIIKVEQNKHTFSIEVETNDIDAIRKTAGITTKKLIKTEESTSIKLLCYRCKKRTIHYKKVGKMASCSVCGFTWD